MFVSLNFQIAFSVTFKFNAPEYNIGVTVLQCEVCGRPIIGKPHRVIIEGVKMLTCGRCAELGSGYWEPEPKSFRRPEGFRTAVSIPVRRKRTIDVSEDLVVTEGFGSIVRQARVELGLSHEDLGRKIGEKVSVLRKVESGKMTPDHRLAGKLEHALEVKLLVPFVVPKVSRPASPASKGVTLGEIVRLKDRRRHPENEGDHS
ncbi:MAG: multiprotein bridging factor aMBF1 [Candidatus Bathyarchaeota archaeon]|nr:multiprotein bridging factor aMBF1 [Candidatus Bathyarchaeota archaeon]